MTKQSDTPATTEYFLQPGYIYLPERPTVISTVLGSSVAVGLYVYIGGQTAVIMTDLVQGIILLVANTPVGILSMGLFSSVGAATSNPSTRESQ